MDRYAFFLMLALVAGACSPIPQPDPISVPSGVRAQLETAINAYGREKFSELTYTVALGGKALEVKGELDGVIFVLRLPQTWNKKGVIWTHGYVLSNGSTPTGFSELPGSSDTLLTQGFAYTASAYAKGGYAIQSAIQESAKLRELLSRLNGFETAYIYGASMGGNVGMGLLEKTPQAYSGALLVCGVVSGWERQMEYLSDFRVVYDYYTKSLGSPIALPGSDDIFRLNTLPSAKNIQDSVNTLFARNSLNDITAQNALAQITQVTGAPMDPISHVTMLTLLSSGTQDYLDTAGGNGYSNIGKTYAGSSDNAALNAGVARFQAMPAATAYLKANYTPTGRFSAKVLTLHNPIEPLVPFRAQTQLKEIVAAAGNTENLVQQIVNARPFSLETQTPKHCDFTSTQLLYAWNELRDWVEKGVKPEDGRNITGIK